MRTQLGHLGYCTNIHSGEEWAEHFSILQQSIPEIKSAISPDQPLGLGLRIANKASIELSQNADQFKKWLKEQNCYVFTMNGFPYGEFHNAVVKDKVHAPDWTTTERKEYTIRIFRLLSELLPEELNSGGISTSPLSYRFWHEDLEEAIRISTENILEVVQVLIELKQKTGKSLHLDIEPEPDGILENSTEFIDWYQKYLIPQASEKWQNASEIIREHVQLCYDVCHFAVVFEEPVEVIRKMEQANIRTGKIQISSALKVDLRENELDKIAELSRFNEPVYLHQVVALKKEGGFESFPDLPLALAAFSAGKYTEWRIHFHVPLFTKSYHLLESTQLEIIKTLEVLKSAGFTDQMEVETYTWSVLPDEMQLPLNDSIIRELQWVKNLL